MCSGSIPGNGKKFSTKKIRHPRNTIHVESTRDVTAEHVGPRRSPAAPPSGGDRCCVRRVRPVFSSIVSGVCVHAMDVRTASTGTDLFSKKTKHIT